MIAADPKINNPILELKGACTQMLKALYRV